MNKYLEKIIKPIKAHKKISLALGATLVIGSVFGPTKIKAVRQGAEAKYETATVRKENIRQVVSASGKVTAENKVALKFQTSGQLAWVGVKEGDWVKKWQAIASLDKRELKKKVEKELNDYLNERWNFEEDRDSYNVSTDNLDQYLLSDTAKRVLQKAQFDLNNTVLDVEIADLTEKLASIVTPIEGIVTEIDTPVAGVNITPASAVFTIADPSEMKFVAEIDEVDIGKIMPEQKVNLFLDAYPEEPIEGRIKKIGFTAVATKGGGNAFEVEIQLPENSNEKFKLGMNGDMDVIVAETNNALTIPLEALVEKDGKKYVRVIKNKKVEEVEITTGIESDDKIEVVQGLDENQKIIIGEKSKKKDKKK